MLGSEPPRASGTRTAASRLTRVPLSVTLTGLARDPLAAFERIGAQAGGEIARLDLGLFRPYLVTSPDHVQHVLVDNADNYRREGMLWRPVRQLIGYGLGSDGPSWAASRAMLQPVFSARRIAGLIGLTAAAVNEAVDDLDAPARAGRPVDAMVTMTRLVDRAAGRAFFGERISPADAERLGEAMGRAFTSLGARMVLPFLPEAAPLPGSRAFRRAVRTVDEIVYPLIDRCRSGGAVGDDVVSLLCRAQQGRGLTDRQVRDDLVAMLVAGSETAAVALTWLWVALDRNPAVAQRLAGEVHRVVGGRQVRAQDLDRLSYARLVLQELLRLYPTGWLIPRHAERADTIAGVRLAAGSTVLVSPYLTHRLPQEWERPDEFDPQRFAPESVRRRHRYAYLPFGGGPHQCLGSHFFMAEARLIVGAVLGRYRTRVLDAASAVPRAAVTLRPRRPVELVLQPLSGR